MSCGACGQPEDKHPVKCFGCQMCEFRCNHFICQTFTAGEVSPELAVWVKRPYAHRGKRRRSYTEEMFRCQIVDQIHKHSCVCNHLLWRNKPSELREHLTEHMKVDVVKNLSDTEVLSYYTDAKKIYLQAIPEDGNEDPNEDLEEEDE